MSNEMIERVARAIYNNADPTCEWDEALNRDIYFTVAKAAIAVMREPTEEMLDAGDVEGDAEFIYKRMIDSALKE